MSPSLPITELYGIYNANGGLVGELAYVAGKLFGIAHCALCDITHSGISEKSEFKACRTAQTVPLTTLHLNEQAPDLAAFTRGQTPCVVGKHPDGTFRLLLDAQRLEDCNRSVQAFAEALEQALGP